MRAHQIDDHGLILNTIEVVSLEEVVSLGIFHNLIDASIGGGPGDSILNGQLITKILPITVPQSITMRQARLVLFKNGLLQTVNDFVNNLPGPQGDAARIEWEFSNVVERHRPLISALAPMLNMSDHDLDNLFVEGNKL